MPKFLDHHKMMGPMPAGMVEKTKAAIKAGQADPATGVKGLQQLWSKDEVWCLTEAPSAQAVHKYHEAMGIKLGAGDVTEVQSAV